MAILFAQCVLPFGSGLPTDVATNTWWFQGEPTLNMEDSMEAVAAALSAFYGTKAPGATNAVGYYLSSVVDRADCYVQIYDLADPEPRPPHLYDLTVAVGANTALPNEVAWVMSFHGRYPKQARQRGRLYLGPLTSGTATSPDGLDVRPNIGFIDDVGLAAQEMAASEIQGFTWSVYSRINGTAVPVEGGWGDNAYDTQRRRGLAPTTRYSWAGGL